VIRIKPQAVVALVAYLATIPLANWFISNVGTEAFPGGPHTIPVGFGFQAPSGVLLIGLGLATRDAVQRLAGLRWTFAAIAVGVALSWVINPAIAFASAVAFALGELGDLAVYSPLSRRNLPLAVLASGVVGAVIDTFVFLQLAFGSSQFWQGQLIGKTIITVLCALVVWIARAVPVRLPSGKA
jgi:uncharacterized PurR-regulated membrane protein YhhQ (DUF165 family)